MDRELSRQRICNRSRVSRIARVPDSELPVRMVFSYLSASSPIFFQPVFYLSYF